MTSKIQDFLTNYYLNYNLTLLTKLTLVIPTYNRNYYLSRCLWYHAHFPFGQIIVADSSPEEKKITNRDTVSKIQEIFGINILYLEYEPETEIYGGDIYRKWADAVQHVTTEYSQIVTDKEFAVPLGLVDAIRYLDSHPDYVAADARNYFLVYSKDIQETAYVYRQRRTDRHSETSEDPIERFQDAFMSTSPMHNCLIPSIMRSQVRSEISQYITSKQVNDIRLGEYLQGYFPHIRGKYHYNPALISLVRDTSVLTSQKQKNTHLMNSSESSTTRYPSVQYYIDNNLEDFFKSFRLVLIRELSKNTSLSLDDIRKFVLNNFPNSYFSRYYLERVTIINRLSSPLVRKIWNTFPLKFKNLIKKSVQLIFNQTLSTNTPEEIIDTDDGELNLILDIVRETMVYHSGDERLSELDL